MAARGRVWFSVVVLSVVSAGCIDLSRPSGQAGTRDAAVRPADAAVDAARPDAPAMIPEDEPPHDGGMTFPDAPVTDGAGGDASSGDGAVALACSQLYRDDFESGNLAGWDRTFSTLPTVTSSGAIAGTRSLSTRLGSENAAGRSFTPSTGVAFQFIVDLASMTTTGSIPNLAALLGSGLDYNLISVYFGRDSNGPVISVVTYVNGSTSERISRAKLPASRATIRVEWHAGTSTDGGVARLFVDGALWWTSPPLANSGTRADQLRLGNAGGAGSGNVLYDDVVLENCQ